MSWNFLLQFVFFRRWGVLKNTRDIVKSEAFVVQHDVRDKWKKSQRNSFLMLETSFVIYCEQGRRKANNSFRLLRVS